MREQCANAVSEFAISKYRIRYKLSTNSLIGIRHLLQQLDNIAFPPVCLAAVFRFLFLHFSASGTPLPHGKLPFQGVST